MAYGITKKLPEDNQEVTRRLSLRYLRAAGPHNEWAKIAKQCTNFLEGKQWSDEQLADMYNIKRSALTINKIAPLWRLVMGYQTSNRVDVTYLPTNDAQSTQDTGTLISNVFKSEANRIDLNYTDSDVFADGLTTGRGFWDTRLCFEENDFGEVRSDCSDPFSVYVDPDCDKYDLNEGAAYVQESVWTDVDSINSQFGSDAALAVENVMTPHYSSSTLSYLGEEDVSPTRYFGQYADDKSMDNWSDVYHTDFVDLQAKRIRLLDSQYKIRSIKPCFLDLETGDREPIPDDWLKPENHYKIDAALKYAESMGNPIRIVRRPVNRVRWTVTCSDILLFDDWSPYERYTKTMFCPYFRRGKTKGMIDDLRDPQMELNKKRSILTDILNRNANSGWIYEEKSLDADQEENLRKFGSAPGINIKYKKAEDNSRPQRIDPGGYPQGLDRLEEKNANDLNQISGINESAMGQMDTVQSGRAIEAKQRQAVLSIQLYADNFSRSKKLQGRKFLEIFQNHYTEERVFRIIGEDSQMAEYEINKKQQTGVNAYDRMNDITVGKYSVNVDEVPISATFKQGQFEETMMLLEKLGPVGMALVQSKPDLLIDQTSLPRKDDWKEGLRQATDMAAEASETGIPDAPTPTTPAQTATPEMMPS